MFGKIFNINCAEMSQPHVKSNVSCIYAFDFHSFEKLSAKVKSGCRSGNCTFMKGINSLISFVIDVFRFGPDPFWNGHFSKSEKSCLELFVTSVKQKAQSSSP